MFDLGRINNNNIVIDNNMNMRPRLQYLLLQMQLQLLYHSRFGKN